MAVSTIPSPWRKIICFWKYINNLKNLYYLAGLGPILLSNIIECQHPITILLDIGNFIEISWITVLGIVIGYWILSNSVLDIVIGYWKLSNSVLDIVIGYWMLSYSVLDIVIGCCILSNSVLDIVIGYWICQT